MKEKLSFKSFHIAGIRIDSITKAEFLNLINHGIQGQKPSYVVTPYSEFFYRAKEDEDFRHALNNSYLSIPDGIFVLWAARFLTMNTPTTPILRQIISLAQYVVTGAAIVFWPRFIKKVVKERIPGSIVAYDVAELAAKNGYKIAILGGFDFGKGNTGTIAAKKLKRKYPKLEITEIYPGDREKEETGQPVIDALKKSGADILFCCYGPVRQEKWLHDNLEKTGITVGLALGGTIDYISGAKKLPPVIFRKLGLEWLVRPLYAERLHPQRTYKRMKRGWFPAMLKSSMMILRLKMKGEKIKAETREI